MIQFTLGVEYPFNVQYGDDAVWRWGTSTFLAGANPYVLPKRTPLNFRLALPSVFEGCGFRRYTFDHHSKAHPQNHFGQ
jgi:hypothetical protein